MQLQSASTHTARAVDCVASSTRVPVVKGAQMHSMYGQRRPFSARRSKDLPGALLPLTPRRPTKVHAADVAVSSQQEVLTMAELDRLGMEEIVLLCNSYKVSLPEFPNRWNVSTAIIEAGLTVDNLTEAQLIPLLGTMGLPVPNDVEAMKKALRSDSLTSELTEAELNALSMDDISILCERCSVPQPMFVNRWNLTRSLLEKKVNLADLDEAQLVLLCQTVGKPVTPDLEAMRAVLRPSRNAQRSALEKQERPQLEKQLDASKTQQNIQQLPETPKRAEEKPATVKPAPASEGVPTQQAATPAASTKKPVAKFAVPYKTSFGQSVKVVGDSPLLGNWNLGEAPNLTWSEGDIWRGEMAVDPAVKLNFKFVIAADGGYQQWENGDNRVLAVPEDAAELSVEGQWDSTTTTVITVTKTKAKPTKADGPPSMDTSTLSSLAAELGELKGAAETLASGKSSSPDYTSTAKGAAGGANGVVAGEVAVAGTPAPGAVSPPPSRPSADEKFAMMDAAAGNGVPPSGTKSPARGPSPTKRSASPPPLSAPSLAAESPSRAAAVRASDSDSGGESGGAAAVRAAALGAGVGGVNGVVASKAASVGGSRRAVEEEEEEEEWSRPPLTLGGTVKMKLGTLFSNPLGRSATTVTSPSRSRTRRPSVAGAPAIYGDEATDDVYSEPNLQLANSAVASFALLGVAVVEVARRLFVLPGGCVTFPGFPALNLTAPELMTSVEVLAWVVAVYCSAVGLQARTREGEAGDAPPRTGLSALEATSTLATTIGLGLIVVRTQGAELLDQFIHPSCAINPRAARERGADSKMMSRLDSTPSRAAPPVTAAPLTPSFSSEASEAPEVSSGGRADEVGVVVSAMQTTDDLASSERIVAVREEEESNAVEMSSREGVEVSANDASNSSSAISEARD